jgi:glycosyltransferase involved in cell wall biosynthesis
VADFTSSRGLISPQVIGRLERRLIEAVDLLIVTAPALLESKRNRARRVILVPNGVEAEHFARAADPALAAAEELAGLEPPIVGYLGTLNYWIDTHLLGRLAREHPDWTLVLVGPHDLLADLSPLEGLPNVIRTGRVPYADLPGYVKVFDVCVNPYVLDGVAEHCSPLKLYEYLASGKPVVSVDMPEARQFAGLVHIARDSDEFVRLVEGAVANGDGDSAARMEEARDHTWRKRFADVSAALADVLAASAG